MVYVWSHLLSLPTSLNGLLTTHPLSPLVGPENRCKKVKVGHLHLHAELQGGALGAFEDLHLLCKYSHS